MIQEKRKSHTRQHHRQQEWQYRQHQQDEPPRPKVCARCPSDRAVLAKKGAVSVLMDTPPIIPCHPWSSVEKVRQEIVAGPQPGSEVPEGSHKIVIQLYHHRRTLSTCVTRYNVIVRKCPDLEVGPGVHTDCPLGKAWGAHCNVTCDPGYELEGDTDTECTDDLEWSGVMPQCIPTTSCPVPVSPDNGHISCRTPQHQPVRPRGAGMLPDGSVCHYRCDAGYTIPPAQAHLTRVRCVGGSWDSDQDPTCIETNSLEEEEPPPEITAEDALRFDSEDCPEHFCKNGGKCIMILNEPMCSCLSGYSGFNCEDLDIDPDPDESNTIT
ncbi:hypothetical protein J6590_078585 [Homalodisca vitripennis]|nr:hypothetical protein J6590_078585 [Homalodisca vitripennis]